MKLVRTARFLHKLAGLIVGIQILLWMVSGLYMTAIPIETVRGNHLVTAPEFQFVDATNLVSIETLFKKVSDVSNIELSNIRKRPVYKVTNTEQVLYFDAQSLEPLPLLSEKQATELATQVYQGEGDITLVNLIGKNEPVAEIRGRDLPVWRIQYDDFYQSTLYISAITAKVVAVRSDIWRIFDFFWMLHIMDYDERSDFNNPLVIFMASIGVFLSLSGLLMLANGLRRYGFAYTK